MSETKDRLRFFGVVPAAGMSRRMGRSKQTITVGGRTLAATVVHTLLQAGADRVVVVTRTVLTDRLALPADPRVAVAINDDPGAEMIDSIRIALAALAGSAPAMFVTERPDGEQRPYGFDVPPRPLDGILVIPADCPAVPVSACHACMDAYRREPGSIIVAGCDGRRGHPLLFPFALREEVDRLPGGLNRLTARLPDRLRVVDTRDRRVLADIDTPSDLAAYTHPDDLPR